MRLLWTHHYSKFSLHYSPLKQMYFPLTSNVLFSSPLFPLTFPFPLLLSPLTFPSLPSLQACKAALQRLGPLMSSKRVNKMFQKHLKPEDSLLYADFLNDLCKLIVSHSCLGN